MRQPPPAPHPHPCLPPRRSAQAADDADVEIDAVWFGMGLPFAGSDGRLAYNLPATRNAKDVALLAGSSSSSGASASGSASEHNNSGRGWAAAAGGPMGSARGSGDGGAGDSAASMAGIAGLPAAVRRNSAALLSAVLSDDVALAPVVAGISGSLLSQTLDASTGGARSKGALLPPAAEARRRLDNLSMAAVSDIDAGTRFRVSAPPGSLPVRPPHARIRPPCRSSSSTCTAGSRSTRRAWPPCACCAAQSCRCAPLGGRGGVRESVQQRLAFPPHVM